MALIVRLRTAKFTFQSADGIKIDPAGNVLVQAAVKVTDPKTGKEFEDAETIFMGSPNDFLHAYDPERAEVEEVEKPG